MGFDAADGLGGAPGGHPVRDLDVAFDPAGVADYSQWENDATMVTVLGVPVLVASLDDIIRSDGHARTTTSADEAFAQAVNSCSVLRVSPPVPTPTGRLRR